MGLASNVMILFAAVVIATVAADTDISQAAKDATTIKDGSTFCPPGIGALANNRCPDPSVFHYYGCCGDLMKDCCFNLQLWVMIVLGVIAVIVIAGFVLSIVRCLFCRR